MWSAEPTATALPLSLDLPVLGLPVRFETDAPTVLHVVEETFGTWRGIRSDTRARPFRVRITAGRDTGTPAVPADSARGLPARVRHIVPDASRLLVYSPDVIGCSEPRERTAFAHVTQNLLNDRVRFREDVLEALTLGLLTRFDRQPLHAAALVRDGAAVLLAGPSGAGKSTLALAAACAGIAVLAEDMVFLQSAPHLRVWGMIHGFRLLPDAVPSLAADALPTPARRPGDPLKLHVPLAGLPAADRPHVADRCVLCVLGARRPAAAIRRIDAEEAIAALDLDAGGFDVFAGTIRPVLARLAAAGAWMLHPERAAEASVPLLERILDDAARSAVHAQPQLQRIES